MEPEEETALLQEIAQRKQTSSLLEQCDTRRLTFLKRFREYPDEFPPIEQVVFPVDNQGNPDPHNGNSTKWLEARFVMLMSPIEMVELYGDNAYNLYTVWGADGAHRLWGDTCLWAMRQDSIHSYCDYFVESARFYNISPEVYVNQMIGTVMVHQIKGEFAQLCQQQDADSVIKICNQAQVLSKKARVTLCKGQPPIDLLSVFSQFRGDNQYKQNWAKIRVHEMERLPRELADHYTTVLQQKTRTPENRSTERRDLPSKIPKLVEEVPARFIEDEDDPEEAEGTEELSDESV